jgi:hypothetical protein
MLLEGGFLRGKSVSSTRKHLPRNAPHHMSNLEAQLFKHIVHILMVHFAGLFLGRIRSPSE